MMVPLDGATAPTLPTNGTAALPSLGDRPTIKDEIYAALRERIVFGEIGPGDRLVETDLAARFGVSKTPVREALLTLEAEGLVILRPHRGGVVSPLSTAEYRDLQFVRDALEFGAIDAVVTTMTATDFAAADAHLAEMEAAFRAHDYRRYRRAQRALHHRLLSAPGRPSLPTLAVHLNDRLDRYGRLLLDGRPERWAADLAFNHRRVELIRLGDAGNLVRMVKARHEEALAMMPGLLGEQDDRSDHEHLSPSPRRGGEDAGSPTSDFGGWVGAVTPVRDGRGPRTRVSGTGTYQEGRVR